MGGNGAHRLGGDAGLRRHGAGRVRQQDHAAAGLQLRLPRVDRLQQLMGRRRTHHAHEGRAGDAHAGQVVRDGEAIGDVPARDVGLREQVPQKPEPRHLHGEANGLRRHLVDFDFKQVAWLRAIDINGAGQGMHQAQVASGHLGRVAVHVELPVEGVPRLHADDLPRVNLRRGLDVRMPAVVSRLWLGA